MLSTGIVVCPVENAAFLIPLIFTIKRDVIPSAKIVDPGGQIDVVRDQQCLAVAQPQDEPLMP
jgi:hypothetical protein